MPDFLKNLRAFATGQINESTLSELNGNDEGYDFENDEEFIQECMNVCMPTMISMMLMDESAEELDENVRNACIVLNDYLVGQGIISEAATVSLSNPKINVVRLNKQAQLNRLSTIITLKMARKDNIKAYQKYKLGQKIKKTNMEEMKKRYGAKADRLAKKLWKKTSANGKIAAVVDSKKAPAKK